MSIDVCMYVCMSVCLGNLNKDNKVKSTGTNEAMPHQNKCIAQS